MPSLVLPKPDGQERGGPLAQMDGSITKALQLLNTAGRDCGSDIQAGEGVQAPVSPPASVLLRRGKGRAQQFCQPVLKGAAVVS